MNIITLDFETHFSDDYSLSKMTTESYIRDPRFEAHGCAIKFSPDLPAKWWNGPELPELFAQIKWNEQAVLCHHYQFDGFILNHHYGVRPRFAFDTLSMARLLLGNHMSVSLDSVRKHFGIAPKTTPYGLFKNKHWGDMPPDVQNLIAAGACDEVESIYEIFKKLAKDTPPEEFEVIDTVVRMFTEPVLKADIDMLAKVWTDEAERKQAMMQKLGVSEADLQSSERFAQLLRDAGVEPEMKQGKVSTKTGKSKENFAFAKTDDFMRDLLESDNDEVRTLAEARLGVKSTIMQTRAETLGWMAHRGSLCVYLRYAGAGTLRVSGGDGCLTADTRVLTLDISGMPKYKNIVDVLVTDLVWDGEEFVEHDGVAFSGYKEVISWNGVSGTPDHQVRCGETWQSLSEAIRAETPILDCREPTTWEVEIARAFQRSRPRS